MKFSTDHGKARLVLSAIALGALLAATPGCVPEDIDEESGADEDVEVVGEAASKITWGVNGHTYWLRPEPVSWVTANIGCDSRPGFYLASINSPREQAWLHQQIYEHGGSWWIGYNDRATEGVWQWVQSGGTYSNWPPGWSNNDNQDCAVIRSSDGYWNDLNCGVLRYYICERNY